MVMGTKEILIWMIPTMVLATQISRLSPLFLSSWAIPKSGERWLAHVPIAMIAALVVPDFLSTDSHFPEIGFHLSYLIGGLISVAVGVKTRNLILTTASGVLTVALLRFLI